MIEPLRFLYVEDEPGDIAIFQDVLFKVFSFDECELETAGTVEAAQHLLREGSYDAVFLDYDLPGDNGLQLIPWLEEQGVQCPVIMVTGKGGESVAVEAFRLGAGDYIQKSSLDEKTLSHAVFQVLVVSGLERAKDRAQSHDIASTALQNAAFEASSDAIVVVSVDGAIELANPKLRQLAGDVLPHTGRSIQSILHHDDTRTGGHVVEDCPLLAAIAEGRPFEGRETILGNEMEEVPVSARCVSLPIGRSPGALIAMRDLRAEVDASRGRQALTNARAESAELRREDQFLSDLLNAVAHEAFTPLTPIKIQLAMLRKHVGEEVSPPTDQAIAIIEANVERLSRFFDQLVLATRLRSQRHIPRRETWTHQKLIEGAIKSAQVYAKGRGVTLDEHIDEGELFCDASDINRILTTMLTSAVAGSPRDTVIIRVYGDKKWTTFEVEDHRSSLTDDDLYVPSKGFRRTADLAARANLPLFVAASLAVANDGSLSMHTAPGGGLLQRLRILGEPPEPADAQRQSHAAAHRPVRPRPVNPAQDSAAGEAHAQDTAPRATK